VKIKPLVLAALAVTCAATTAYAQGSSPQSSVTLYGLVDAGLSWINNQGGRSTVKFDDAIAVPTFLGFRGNEDLGGGTSAIFDLEAQFTLVNGASIGNMFGRDAWVGLKNPRWGTLTLGNQFDFMNDALTISGNAPQVSSGGLYNYPAGPFQKLMLPYAASPNGSADWDRTGQQSVANSVKYVTPTWGGLRLGAMYAFAGSANTGNRAVSFGINYDQPTFGVGAAYTSVAYAASAWADGTQIPAETVRNWGLGGHYVMGPLTAVADFTTVRNTNNGAAVYQASIGGLYNFNQALSLGFAYTYLNGNRALDNNHANQLGASLNYAFSKRTMVYVSGVYQLANKGANALFNGIYDGADLAGDSSSGRMQRILRIGIRSMF
jgi:predicted porin